VGPFVACTLSRLYPQEEGTEGMYAGTLEKCVASPSNWKFRNLSFPLLLAFTLLALRKLALRKLALRKLALRKLALRKLALRKLALRKLALRKEVQHARQAETTLVYTQRKRLSPNNEKRFLIEFILSLPLFMFRIRTNNHNFSSSPY
jgi:hypothetical protein